MININKGEVHIKGEFVEIVTEIVLGIRDLMIIAKDNGIDNSELLGGIIAGIYNIRDKEGHLNCNKLGKFIDYKCKEMKNK